MMVHENRSLLPALASSKARSATIVDQPCSDEEGKSRIYDDVHASWVAGTMCGC